MERRGGGNMLGSSRPSAGRWEPNGRPEFYKKAERA
jgi:hypothetical protein